MTSSYYHSKYNKHVMNISWFYLVTISRARIGKDNILEERGKYSLEWNFNRFMG